MVRPVLLCHYIKTSNILLPLQLQKIKHSYILKMNKKTLFTLAFLLSISFSFSQTLEELKATLAVQKDSLKVAQDRVNTTQGKIDSFPGWKKGAFGTIGGSVSNFSNWYAQKTPNNRSGNIGFTMNAFANLDTESFFLEKFWKLEFILGKV